MVALLRPGELSGQVRQRHHMLRAGLQVLELHVALSQLVADDDGKVGMLLGGGLQLAVVVGGTPTVTVSRVRLASVPRAAGPTQLARRAARLAVATPLEDSRLYR